MARVLCTSKHKHQLNIISIWTQVFMHNGECSIYKTVYLKRYLHLDTTKLIHRQCVQTKRVSISELSFHIRLEQRTSLSLTQPRRHLRLRPVFRNSSSMCIIWVTRVRWASQRWVIFDSPLVHRRVPVDDSAVRRVVKGQQRLCLLVWCVCVCVCVRERERGREREFI